MAGSNADGMRLHFCQPERSGAVTMRSQLNGVLLLVGSGLLLTTVVACQRPGQSTASNTSAAEAARNSAKTTEDQANFTPASDNFPAEPKHQVVARYFHRTERCPTCVKISGLIEESVQSGFGDHLKSGKVKLQMVDYQDARNQELTATYKISDPMLVIMNVHEGKVTEWKLAPKIWALFMKKDAFLKYVQDEMHAYLEEEPAPR